MSTPGHLARKRFLAVMALALLPLCTSASDPTTAAPTADYFRGLIEKRAEAGASGDVAAYRQLIDPELVHIDDMGTRRTRETLDPFIAGHAGSKDRIAISDVNAVVHDDIALVESVVTVYTPFGSREVVASYPESDVFVRRDGRWRFLRIHQAIKPLRPERDRSSERNLEDYVGEYRWWPGFSETVSIRDGALHLQETGIEPSAQLVAASRDVFFIPDVPFSITFIRDRNGKITHYVSRSADGRMILAAKVR